MKRTIVKTICALTALFPLVGCGDSDATLITTDLFRSGPERRWVESKGSYRTPFGKVITYGDIIPYGSLDYVIVGQSDSTGRNWESGRLITRENPELADYQPTFLSFMKK